MADLVPTIESGDEGEEEEDDVDFEMGRFNADLDADPEDDEDLDGRGQWHRATNSQGQWKFTGVGKLESDGASTSTTLMEKIEEQKVRRVELDKEKAAAAAEKAAKLAAKRAAKLAAKSNGKDGEKPAKVKKTAEKPVKEEDLVPAAPPEVAEDEILRAPAKTRETGLHLKAGITFAALNLSRPLLRAVTELNYSTPTPVQAEVIPMALEGRDILATAETGSGKTAAFLLPVLDRLLQSPQVKARTVNRGGGTWGTEVGTKVLIMLPSRELAVQCTSMLKALSNYTLITHLLVAGGFSHSDQAAALRKQPDIVICTPGRILDLLINAQSVHLELMEIVILDEADRLLEMGFKNECSEVLRRCARGRQTMLFSATFSKDVQDLASLALHRPIRVQVGQTNKVARTLEQEFVKVTCPEDREPTLLALCDRTVKSKTIIFVNTKKAAHRLAVLFGFFDKTFSELHGNVSQTERVSAVDKFQKGEAQYMIATDLAARGLDLPNVDVVINVEVPNESSKYVHRVGRTARMGNTGRSVTIFDPTEYRAIKTLAKKCKAAVDSKVLRRQVAEAAVEYWRKQIEERDPDVKEVLSLEGAEREQRLAEIKLAATTNRLKFKDDIQSRPLKEWILSPDEKIEYKKNLSESHTAFEDNLIDSDDEAPRQRRREKESLEEEIKALRSDSESEDSEAVPTVPERKLTKAERRAQHKQDQQKKRMDSLKFKEHKLMDMHARLAKKKVREAREARQMLGEDLVRPKSDKKTKSKQKGRRAKDKCAKSGGKNCGKGGGKGDKAVKKKPVKSNGKKFKRNK